MRIASAQISKPLRPGVGDPPPRASGRFSFAGILLVLLSCGAVAHASLLWSDHDARLTHHTAEGYDILGGATKRDDTASDALYFKFHVNPLSDAATEEYFAAFQLFEGNEYRLAVGNAPEAWGYSAFFTAEMGPSNKVSGEFNLASAQPEAAGLGVFKPYELPLHDHEQTLVFKVQYIPGGDDLVTVWLNPDLSLGATVDNQPKMLTTQFKANASFNQIRLRHGGKGNGWMFSDMAIATSFSDFIVQRFWQTWWFAALNAVAVLAGVGLGVRLVVRRNYQRRLQLAEQERTLEKERNRIAQDLHDDLGSSLARISLLSSLVLADCRDPEQVETHARKLAQSADATVRALEEIVWAVRPRSDTLQSLVEYIAHFANELFEGNHTRCRLDLPHDLPAQPLPPDLRHNIFLVVKEALTNVLKHAGASEVHVQAKVSSQTLEIQIQDNGRGLKPTAKSAPAEGHGLENMRRRAESIGGTLTIQSQPAGGSTVRLTVNFPAWKAAARQRG